MLRLASYNVENLFERAKLLNSAEWSAAEAILEKFVKLNGLLNHEVYSLDDKADILRCLTELGLKDSDDAEFVRLRSNRGRLLVRRDGETKVVANGRPDWIGWLELRVNAVNEIATQNTARVIRDVNAQIMVTVEAEHRPSLMRFNEQVLAPLAGWRFEHVLLIDGNDERGIDVGLLSRAPYAVDFMRSHVDDMIDGERLFSRDCAEYHMALPDGRRLAILANHFKSKSTGSSTQAENDTLRKKQARRVREIYEGLRATGHDLVAVMGDLNDSPLSAPLAPLLAEGSDLKDASELPFFDFAGRPGTWRDSEAKDKIDYILMSPALFQLARGGGIYRAGVWGGRDGTLFPHLPEITTPTQAASDHAAIYVDLDL